MCVCCKIICNVCVFLLQSWLCWLECREEHFQWKVRTHYRYCDNLSWNSTIWQFKNAKSVVWSYDNYLKSEMRNFRKGTACLGERVHRGLFAFVYVVYFLSQEAPLDSTPSKLVVSFLKFLLMPCAFYIKTYL